MNDPVVSQSLAPKPIFQSKTAFAGVLTAIAGAVGISYPDFGKLLGSHASEILIGLGILHVVLRRVTKGRVVLFGDGGS